MTERTATLNEAIGISERLSPSDRLRLIGILSEQLRSELEQPDGAIDMLTLTGLGAEIWKDLDIPSYLEQERASWDG
jgi:hypothetical protein